MIEVLKQALEALETPKPLDDYPPILNAYAKTINNAIASLRQAIAELESQEPVAYINVEKRIFEWAKLTSWETPTVVNLPKIPLYTHPPQRTEPKVCCQQYDTCLEPCTPRGEHLAQRTWVGLTKEDKDLIEDLCEMMIGDAAFSTIEAILKGKNT